MNMLPPPEPEAVVRPRHRGRWFGIAAVVVGIGAGAAMVATRGGGGQPPPTTLPSATIYAIAEATWQTVPAEQRAAWCGLYTAGAIASTEPSFVASYLAKGPANTKADAEATWRYLASTISARECAG